MTTDPEALLDLDRGGRSKRRSLLRAARSLTPKERISDEDPGDTCHSLPGNREEAIELLQKVSWDLSQLSPEEVQAVRKAFALDDDRSVSERIQGEGGP